MNRTMLDIPGSSLDDPLSRALVVARYLHRDQKRKGTNIPYISHLMAVSAIVMEAGGSEEQQIAGVLHDVVEDTSATVDDIDRSFGPAVAAIVRACSDTEVQPKPRWPERKATYVNYLSEVSADALLVSLADKVHNARCILADYRQEGPQLWSRFNDESMGAAGQLWCYRSLVSAFGLRRDDLAPEARYLVDELAGLVSSLESDIALREPDAIVEAQRFAVRRP